MPQLIRTNLLELRRRRPRTAILLLGLWPREDVPRTVERHEIGAVNALISKCADDRIRYADLGGRLAMVSSVALMVFTQASMSGV